MSESAKPDLHEISIGDEKFVIGWTQGAARQYRFRASRLGLNDEVARLADPLTVEAALFEILWCLVPEAVAARFPTPESLYLAIDHEKDGAGIWKAVVSIVKSQTVKPAKKKRSKNSRSRK